MPILLGASVYSDRQAQRELSSWQSYLPGLLSFVAYDVYGLKLKCAPSWTPPFSERLSQLLALPTRLREEDLTLTPSQQLAQKIASQPGLQDTHRKSFWVLPRLGVLTSWSSKATELLQHSGLEDVEYIEKGRVYVLTIDENASWSYVDHSDLWCDRMTEVLLPDAPDEDSWFADLNTSSWVDIPLLEEGLTALQAANQRLGLGCDEVEMRYLYDLFQGFKRNPTELELMMFAQVNSEHCRHKIFNAQWWIDGQLQPYSLFDMIRHTHEKSPQGVWSAYRDNGAALETSVLGLWQASPEDGHYRQQHVQLGSVIKVETHNHPTAISPWEGAATGVGGEIRDEGATGRGARPRAGLCGFSVADLHLPHLPQPWELIEPPAPTHIASSLEIMLQGPLGAAAFNNEFGRPNLAGYFRTYSAKHQQRYYGYYKPIMLAGGMATIRSESVHKRTVEPGALLAVIGGPAMLIGLGGGCSSSCVSGTQTEDLDFASVQRSNPEMQRRCQQLLEACYSYGEDNPIQAIHDVGAGGLANALPELIATVGQGGLIDLSAIPCADASMSPMALWCNEAQERYVLAICEKDWERFKQWADREHCPCAVVGRILPCSHLEIQGGKRYGERSLSWPLEALWGRLPRKKCYTSAYVPSDQPWHSTNPQVATLQEAAERVLQLPAVADKSFLITIGDRTVGGLVTRDPMVGPWQVPVADVAVTALHDRSYVGQAMALGERAPLAVVNAVAAARMAVGEVITNLAAAPVKALDAIKLSANWMAACGEAEQDAALYAAVEAIGRHFCPALGLCIPVGKDSLSMRTVWRDQDQTYEMIAPLSLVVSGFAEVDDVRDVLTPQLSNIEDTCLVLINLLPEASYDLGTTAYAQVFNNMTGHGTDAPQPQRLKNFFAATQQLRQKKYLLAYHDRSDGGLWACVCEMAFASRTGVRLDLSDRDEPIELILFHESLGAVVQIRKNDWPDVHSVLSRYELAACSSIIGTLDPQDRISVYQGKTCLLSAERTMWQRLWSKTSYHLQKCRDDPTCAEQEYDRILQTDDPGLEPKLTWTLDDNVGAPYVTKSTARPKVAVLREQGVNGHLEMAAAFDSAGFTSVDVTLYDLLHGHRNLQDYSVLAVCGGFSYGDVFGAGQGWAARILYDPRLYDQLSAFFARSDTLTLGVCNGCQMLSHLRELIPTAGHFPRFTWNLSQRFEARLCRVALMPSSSVWLDQMQGSHLPVVVSHAEGRVVDAEDRASQLLALCYIDHHGQPTTSYPYNPNGSEQGFAGTTSLDGRVLIMMPHPERVFRNVQLSWCPPAWRQHTYSPWWQLFLNARRSLG